MASPGCRRSPPAAGERSAAPAPRKPAGRGGGWGCGPPLPGGGMAGGQGSPRGRPLPPRRRGGSGGSMWVAAPLLLLLLLLLPVLLARLRRRGAVPLEPAGRAVLITGCDSGFGHLLALRLHRLGFTVFAGCLCPGGEGARRLQREGSVGAGRLHVLRLDVTRACDVLAAKELVLSHLPERGERGGAERDRAGRRCRWDRRRGEPRSRVPAASGPRPLEPRGAPASSPRPPAPSAAAPAAGTGADRARDRRGR